MPAVERSMGRVARALLVLVAAVLVAPARADEGAVRAAIRAATVAIESPGCTGVVSESPQLVLTAKHCVAGASLRIRLSTGDVRTAWVVATNAASDQAVLFLEEPAGVAPLDIARRPQIPGTVLYFSGHPDRPRFQSARLDRIGVCPSLPDLPNALFTTIDGAPGDSGAPIVDAAARIVGLVHGGARCHIATPANTLARLVDGVLRRPLVDLARTPSRAKLG
jgi:Trypsin-like peptidase domain